MSRETKGVAKEDATSDERGIFDSVSPVDYRYGDPKITAELSENAFTVHKCDVEQALIAVLVRRGIAPKKANAEVEAACKALQTKDVYNEERRIKHDIRALANLIRERVSDEARPFVHMTATSYDIVDTANAARYRDFVQEALLPQLKALMKVLVEATLRDADTVQIGRTHGQHAVPITFGFALANYVSRLGQSIEIIADRSNKLTGKFSGAVGAYNASSLFFDDPEEFEREVLAELNLEPAECSTQIVPPEPMIRLFMEVVIASGILANLADDMRHLQRTEIGEVGEEFSADQVGSSTMPQKRNPINFENTKSLWKAIVPRTTTLLMDQLSEHQRDLTNSASSRTYGEILAYVFEMARRMTSTMKKLRVDKEGLARNLALQQGLIAAEPLYIILAGLGHKDAHEKVRQLTLQAQAENRTLGEIVNEDPEMEDWFRKMTNRQRAIIADPSLYTGIAAKKARAVAEKWRKTFSLG